MKDDDKAFAAALFTFAWGIFIGWTLGSLEEREKPTPKRSGVQVLRFDGVHMEKRPVYYSDEKTKK